MNASIGNVRAPYCCLACVTLAHIYSTPCGHTSTFPFACCARVIEAMEQCTVMKTITILACLQPSVCSRHVIRAMSKPVCLLNRARLCPQASDTESSEVCVSSPKRFRCDESLDTPISKPMLALEDAPSTEKSVKPEDAEEAPEGAEPEPCKGLSVTTNPAEEAEEKAAEEPSGGTIGQVTLTLVEQHLSSVAIPLFDPETDVWTQARQIVSERGSLTDAFGQTWVTGVTIEKRRTKTTTMASVCLKLSLGDFKTQCASAIAKPDGQGLLNVAKAFHEAALFPATLPKDILISPRDALAAFGEAAKEWVQST